MQFHLTCIADAKVYQYTYPVDIGRTIYNRCPQLSDHDSISTHSVSRLWGQADATRRGLVFSGPQSLYIGLLDQNNLPMTFLESLQANSEILPGLTVTDVQTVQPQPGGLMKTVSPILLRYDDKHYTYNDDQATKLLTNKAQAKVQAVLPGINAGGISARFAPDGTESVSVVEICGNKFKGSSCPIVVDAPTEIQELLMTTGIGGLTAMSMGAITPINSDDV